LKGGIYFHPSGDGLPPGAPVKENATWHPWFWGATILEPLSAQWSGDPERAFRDQARECWPLPV
jgi:hypothetical protein